jgi:predicted nucleic-acid-binding protein
MRITPDTNVLVRMLVGDDREQMRLARAELTKAETIALAMPSLCELVWVLRKLYRIEDTTIVSGVRDLIDTENVSVNRGAAEAGLVILEAGGDFADGVIAYDGEQLGGNVFVSFDKRAVSLLSRQGVASRLLGK